MSISRQKEISGGVNMKRLLFVCVENAGRSQMAEAFANHYGKGKLVASSAGVKLSDRVNPLVIEVMKEKGIDISANKPKLLTPAMVAEADQTITMGCSVEKFCPAPLARNVIDWNLEDPKGKPIQKVREIRDEIERKVLTLLDETKATH
jgi:protein-tyrosine-phosphatase